jgi:branched-chain amino acid transport system substrate-binding protein
MVDTDRSRDDNLFDNHVERFVETKLRPSFHRSSAVALLAVSLLAMSACGNRLDHETLREAVTGTQGAPVTAGAAITATSTTDASGAQANAGSAQVPVAPAATGAGRLASGPNAGSAQVPVAPAATRPGQVGSGPRTAISGAKVGAARPATTSGGLACAKPLSPIKIGSVGENSGVMGAVVSAGAKVLQAWVQSVNAKGGLGCHPVEVFVGDDGGDPSAHQALVQRFVEQNGAVAFVFMNAPLAGEAGVKYLKSKGIPVFGSEGGSGWFNENPNYFPQMSSGNEYMEAPFALAGQTLVSKGMTKLATLTCVEATLCSSAYGLAQGFAQKYAMQLVYRGQVSISQPDYTSACLQAKNAGAQILFVALDGNSDQRVARSCQSVGFAPKIVTPAVGITPSQAAAPVLAGIQVAMPVVPWINTGVNAIAEYAAALAKYAGLESGAVGVVGVEAWTAAQVFAFAVSKAGPDITSRSILNGAFQVNGNDFGGLTEPLTYKANAPTQAQSLCWWAAEYNGTKVTSPNGGKRTCE